MSSRKSSKRNQAGFTFIEIMIVVSVVAVLGAAVASYTLVMLRVKNQAESGVAISNAISNYSTYIALAFTARQPNPVIHCDNLAANPEATSCLANCGSGLSDCLTLRVIKGDPFDPTSLNLYEFTSECKAFDKPAAALMPTFCGLQCGAGEKSAIVARVTNQSSGGLRQIVNFPTNQKADNRIAGAGSCFSRDATTSLLTISLRAAQVNEDDGVKSVDHTSQLPEMPFGDADAYFVD